MNAPTEARSGRHWPRRLAAASAVLLLLGALAACRAEYNALGAIFEPRPPALALALAATASFLLLQRRARRKPPATVGLALSLVVLAFAVRLVFFTYDEREVRFESADGTVLAGTIYAPRSAGPHPGVVHIHGSGRETRKEGRFQAKLFARHGIAALVYDKRGAGESGGATWEVGYEGYAEDAAAAVARLAEEPDVDGRRIGLFGQSEGGWVAPLVAERMPAPGPAFVIVTSTTPLTPARQVLYQTGADLERLGYPNDAVAAATALQERVLAYQRTGEPDLALADDLGAAEERPWFEVADLPPELYPPKEYAWWRSVMDFDPVPHWRRVGCPVLAVSGGRDTRSDAEESLRGLRAALAAGGNRRFTGRIFPNMEHGTIEWWLPLHLPPPRFPDGYLQLLVSWTREAVGLDRAASP